MTYFRTVMIAMAATAMLGSQTLAAETSAALAPGKPAGVKEAQGSPNMLVALGVGVAVAGGLAVALSNSGDNSCGTSCNPPVATTGTGSP